MIITLDCLYSALCAKKCYPSEKDKKKKKKFNN